MWPVFRSNKEHGMKMRETYGVSSSYIVDE
jgi:hypothetical protein